MDLETAHTAILSYYLATRANKPTLENLPSHFLKLAESHAIPQTSGKLCMLYDQIHTDVEAFAERSKMPEKWRSDRTYSDAFKSLYTILHDVTEVREAVIAERGKQYYSEVLALCDRKRSEYFNRYNRSRTKRTTEPEPEPVAEPAAESDTDSELDTDDAADTEESEAEDCAPTTCNAGELRVKLAKLEAILLERNREIEQLRKTIENFRDGTELQAYKRLLRDFISTATPIILQY